MSVYERTQLVLGENSTEIFKGSRVIIFGLGGVGSYTAEALSRAGIGTIALVDNDTVSQTNINRQLYALHSTIGLNKTDVAYNRIKDINPDINVIKHTVFATKDNLDEFKLDLYDYIVDAIDCVSTKIALCVYACENNIPIISSMGTGNKTDNTSFQVADIYKTSVCPLARVMRYELRKRNVKKLKVVFSTEEPKKTNTVDLNGKAIPGSLPFVPGTAGLIIAGEVIKDLISNREVHP